MKKNAKSQSVGQFTGVGTALVTPLEKNGQVSYTALAVLVSEQIAGGVNFLVPCGTTGCSPTMDHAEHKRVIREVVRLANGRVPIMGGTGSNWTREAIDLTLAALADGVSGFLIVVPYYNKPTEDGIRGHYRAIAKVAGGRPIFLYDIPGRCGGFMVPARVILELAHEGTIQGLKWASGNLDQLMEVLAGRPTGFKIFSGDDNLTLTAMSLGANGVISVASNLVPGPIVNMVNEMNQRPRSSAIAEAEHFRLLPLMRAMFLETNPIPVTEAMAMVWPHVFKPVFRLPMCRMTEPNRKKLLSVLTEYGLIKAE